MRCGRIAHPEGMCFAVIDDGTAREIAGTPFTQPEFTGRSWPLEQVRLLAPMLPSKICAIGRNYEEHVKELFNASSEALPPIMFLKPPTSVIGPGAPIRIPEWATQVECEAELGLVVGKPCKNVSADSWRDVILGYTIVNDVSSRGLQFADGQWTRAKGLDTFCPLGPWIETDLDAVDVENLEIKSYLTHEGETTLCQDSNTSQMIWSIGTIVEYISSSMTLLPGDIISTGSPAGTAEMVPGDTILIEVPGIGRLSNPVQRA